MKRFIKYPLIILGILFALVLVFIILALCGVFRKKHTYSCGTFYPEQHLQESVTPCLGSENMESGKWIEEHDTIPGVSNVILHRYLPNYDDGTIKLFHSKDSQEFYYNTRHGFYVLLPKEMGYNQQGEPQLGGHFNEFYNVDSTLVISCGGMFYDVLLDDHPHYADTLRNSHLNELRSKGKVQFLSRKSNEIVAKVLLDRKNKDNPPSDYLLSKWILKKDIGQRECYMELNVLYNDSLKNRESEFLNIINKFPNNPFNN